MVSSTLSFIWKVLQWPDPVQRFQSSERRYEDTHQGGNWLLKGTERRQYTKTRKHKDKETLVRHGTKTEKHTGQGGKWSSVIDF